MDYKKIPLDYQEIERLKQYDIHYVFQPIFHSDLKSIYSYEALMRPKGISIPDLLSEYEKDNKLHVLEVLSFFGSAEAHMKRGYKASLSINSFPSECFSDEEIERYINAYPEQSQNTIIEILEYPKADKDTWDRKRKSFKKDGNLLALDDFGKGNNDLEAVDFFKPNIIKMDRKLISGIEHDKRKQERVLSYINTFKKKGMLVLAEGIETKEECDFVIQNGVDLLQGYYLQVPA